MTTTSFETAKVGDKVYDYAKGWGIVEDAESSYSVQGLSMPIKVRFDASGMISNYTKQGTRLQDKQQLFWDEVEIIAPIKPLPDLEVDTKLLVWNDDDDILYRRYFACFSDDGKVCCYNNGKSSWSGYSDEHVTKWDNYRIEGESNG
jgi:hypothetical protein